MNGLLVFSSQGEVSNKGVHSLHIYSYSSAEVLATAIKKDEKIKGISIEGEEIKISHYVDDQYDFISGRLPW